MHSDIRIWVLMVLYVSRAVAHTLPLEADLKMLHVAGEAVARTMQDKRHNPVKVSEVRFDSAKVRILYMLLLVQGLTSNFPVLV
jgi:hypothetical protein